MQTKQENPHFQQDGSASRGNCSPRRQWLGLIALEPYESGVCVTVNVEDAVTPGISYSVLRNL